MPNHDLEPGPYFRGWENHKFAWPISKLETVIAINNYNHSDITKKILKNSELVSSSRLWADERAKSFQWTENIKGQLRSIKSYHFLHYSKNDLLVLYVISKWDFSSNDIETSTRRVPGSTRSPDKKRNKYYNKKE